MSLSPKLSVLLREITSPIKHAESLSEVRTDDFSKSWPCDIWNLTCEIWPWTGRNTSINQHESSWNTTKVNLRQPPDKRGALVKTLTTTETTQNQAQQKLTLSNSQRYSAKQHWAWLIFRVGCGCSSWLQKGTSYSSNNKSQKKTEKNRKIQKKTEKDRKRQKDISKKPYWYRTLLNQPLFYCYRSCLPSFWLPCSAAPWLTCSDLTTRLSCLCIFVCVRSFLPVWHCQWPVGSIAKILVGNLE